jgi:phosphoserine phosphatase
MLAHDDTLSDSPAGATVPRDRCRLDHELFSRLGSISFRRADADGTPIMVVPFGEREAGVPLRSLQHAFNIGDETPDGQMLGLIAESLDYVTALQPGDLLPAEVVSGMASWEPNARHRQTAATRLRLQLLAWLDPAAARTACGADIGERLEADPALRAKVQAAFREAAAELELASMDEVVALVERLTEEFAFIEALRERLLGRVQVLTVRLGQLGHGAARMDQQRREAITQVQRLSGQALAQFRARFEEIDAQTGEIIATLRNADSQIAYIRSNRDTLYRSQRAWETVLETWRKADGAGSEAAWHAVSETYQFLARRYLPASEWPSFNSLRQAGAPRKPEHAMVW